MNPYVPPRWWRDPRFLDETNSWVRARKGPKAATASNATEIQVAAPFTNSFVIAINDDLQFTTTCTGRKGWHSYAPSDLRCQALISIRASSGHKQGRSLGCWIHSGSISFSFLSQAPMLARSERLRRSITSQLAPWTRARSGRLLFRGTCRYPTICRSPLPKPNDNSPNKLNGNDTGIAITPIFPCQMVL